jgi:hypothetical protein
MSGFRRLLLSVFSILTVSVAALVFVPAASAATCSGTGCDGKGPEATGCAASGVTARTGGSGEQLRYSTVCRAYWARHYRPDFWATEVSVERWAPGATRATQRYTEVVEPGTGNDWTLLIGARDGHRYRACYRDPQVPNSTTCSSFWTHNDL